MPPGQVNIHSCTLEPQLQMTCSPAPFPASPKEREPVPESFRENGPSSRTNGTAQGKRKLQGTSESKQACCEAGDRKQEGWSARCPEIRGILARCPAAPAVTDWATSRRSVSWPPLMVPALSGFLLSQAPRNWRKALRGRITDVATDRHWGNTRRS